MLLFDFHWSFLVYLNNNYGNNYKYKAIMKKSEETTPIRQLMPPKFLPKIAQLTRAGRSTISNVVNDEQISSKIWWAVEQLAKETDSKAYYKRLEYIKHRDSTLTGAAA